MSYTAGFSPTGLIRGALSRKSDRALSALEIRTGHSWKLAMDRAQILPEAAGHPAALNLFIRAASGARVTDLDGNAFIDLSMGYGAQILGHNHPVARDAVLAQAERGWDFGLPAADQVELARLIQAASPANERVLLTNTGADALAAACAIARAFTGRSKIVTFQCEAGQCEAGPSAVSQAGPAGEAAWVYGDPAAIARLRDSRPAAIVVEPVPAAAPTLDHVAWLAELIVVALAAGTLIIFDETHTGFRLAFGGAQELLGLIPDLTVYGRAVGGGLPLGALAGRAEVMLTGAAMPGGPADSPISIAAGVATLRELRAHRMAVYPKLNDAGRRLADDFNAVCAAERLPVRMHAVGSMFRIAFDAAPAAEIAFYLFTLSRSIFINTGKTGFLSAAHRTAELDYTASAFAESLRDVRDDGFFTAGKAMALPPPQPRRYGDIRRGEMPQ